MPLSISRRRSFSCSWRASRARSGRTYAKLELERSNVFFLPLTWTIVHPIVEGSPLFGKDPAELAATAAEVLVLVRGFDDAFSQVVNARYSYRHDEILWDRKFTPAFHTDENGHLVLDLAKLNAIEEAAITTKRDLKHCSRRFRQ